LGGRIQRLIDEREVWWYYPELKLEYKRLCKYVKAVKDKDEVLQNMIERYGQKEYISNFS